MLEKQDLQAIQTIVHNELEHELQPIKDDIQVIKDHVTFNHRHEIALLDYIDNRYKPMFDKLNNKIEDLEKQLNQSA